MGTSNHLLPGEDSKNSKTDEVKPVTENEITKKPDLDTEQPDIKSDKYERGNPIFRDEPIHLHGYTWVLILVAIFMMVVFCCFCCQKRKSDSPTYSKLGVSVISDQDKEDVSTHKSMCNNCKLRTKETIQVIKWDRVIQICTKRIVLSEKKSDLPKYLFEDFE